MERQEKQRQYEDYIADPSPMAAAIGRRVPYHLEYLRRYRDVLPVPEGGRDGDGAAERKEGSMGT